MAVAPWSLNTVVQLTLLGTYQNNRIANVFNFEASAVQDALLVTDELASDWAQVVAEDWRDNLQTAWLACVANAYTLESIRGQVVERPNQVMRRLGARDVTPAAPAAGTAGTTSSTPSTCAVIRWKSTAADRGSRGRTYVSPLFQTWTSAGVLQTAGLTAMNAFADAMLTRYKITVAAFQGGFLTVYSRPMQERYSIRRVAGVPTVSARGSHNGNSTAVLSRQVDTILRQQRRRELGVGI